MLRGVRIPQPLKMKAVYDDQEDLNPHYQQRDNHESQNMNYFSSLNNLKNILQNTNNNCGHSSKVSALM